MFRRVLLSTFVITGLVAASFGTAHAATVSPNTWAPKFCKAFQQWQTTLESESTKANAAIAGQSSGDLAGVRDEFVTFLGKDVAATQSVIKSIKSAGTPSSKNGAKIQAKVLGGFQAASKVFSTAEADARALSSTDATSFVADATKIQTSLDGASTAFQTAFDEVAKLDSSNAVDRAISSAKACKFLTG